jgi:hypothetical protein
VKPIQVRRADGTLVEGLIDLAFPETSEVFDGWIVADFETDWDLESDLDH